MVVARHWHERCVPLPDVWRLGFRVQTEVLLRHSGAVVAVGRIPVTWDHDAWRDTPGCNPPAVSDAERCVVALAGDHAVLTEAIDTACAAVTDVPVLPMVLLGDVGDGSAVGGARRLMAYIARHLNAERCGVLPADQSVQKELLYRLPHTDLAARYFPSLGCWVLHRVPPVCSGGGSEEEKKK